MIVSVVAVPVAVVVTVVAQVPELIALVPIAEVPEATVPTRAPAEVLLLVKVSVVARPTIVSVVLGIVNVTAPEEAG